ncbi:flagellin [Paenibacillus sp. B2(2019)]|uniref:flagellin N-terminal helical domain-containing protein n=1 Tax=Paenibacillus sp. B2(2019) TaxID=2607754 RepID=UPI0011F31502|nr:flagellin [Paenibacillus sp. B2(2019)]KAA1178428.1 hypothetical protein PAENI_29590 [Paenibacillus sp. B2(2019)]
MNIRYRRYYQLKGDYMRIGHNITSLNSLNRLNKNNKSITSSLERLSSGLRINIAADDAAGLAISEKMRAQIRGLAQAERNTQDGISLIQTMESGLGTIQDPNLLRLRELALQASNDTLTNFDRTLIQKEVEQIKLGINDIANNTQFNGIHLLNNDLEVNTNITPVQGNISTNWTANIPARDLSKTSDGGYVGIRIPGNNPFKLDSMGNLVWSQAIPNMDVYSIKESSDGGYILLGNDFSADAFSNQKINIIKWDGNLNEQWRTGVSGVYSIMGNEVIETSDGSFIVAGTGSGIQGWDGLVAKFNSNGVQQSTLIVGSSQSNPVGYGSEEFNSIIETADGGYLAIGSSSLKLNGSYTDTSSWVMKYDSNLNPLWDTRVGGTGNDEGYRAIATSDGGAIIVGCYNDSTKISGLIYKLDSSGNVLWEKNDTSASSNFTSISEAKDGNYIIGGIVGDKYKLSIFDPQGNELANATLSGMASTIRFNSLISNDDGSYTFSTTTGITNFNVSYGSNPSTTYDYKTVNLQVGANSGDNFAVKLTDARTTALGIADIDLSTRQGAELAISKIDKAINTVSSKRSMYGAYQNALEHIHNNLTNYEVNLTAAESRIRDVDMAKEMMNLTKYNILSQASQAMLAQANQQPQGVLQLLK